MILDEIAVWIGRVFIWSLIIASILFVWYWTINKLSIIYVGTKALIYEMYSLIVVSVTKEMRDKVRLKKGRIWYTVYKGKVYTWKCIEVKEK